MGPRRGFTPGWLCYGSTTSGGYKTAVFELHFFAGLSPVASNENDSSGRLLYERSEKVCEHATCLLLLYMRAVT